MRQLLSMNRVLLGIFLATGLLSGVPKYSHAAAVSLSVSNPSASVGDVFTVWFTVTGLSSASNDSLAGFDLSLSFDSTATRFAGFSFVDGASGLNQLDWVEPGAFAHLGDATLDGISAVRAFGLSGNSATVLDTLQASTFNFLAMKFEALDKPGTANFSVDTSNPNLLFVNSNSGTLNVTFPTMSASIVINNLTPVPEPATYLLWLTGLAVTLWITHRKRRILPVPGSRSLRGLCTFLVIGCSIGESLAADRSAVTVDEPLAIVVLAQALEQSSVDGVVLEIRGQRLKVRTADGQMRWYTTAAPLGPQLVSKRVQGLIKEVGDTILIERPIFQ